MLGTRMFVMRDRVAVAVDIQDSMTIIHPRDALVAELAYAVG